MKKLLPLAVLFSLLLTLLSASLARAGDEPPKEPPPPPDCGCTYTLGYWKNHPDAWPINPERDFFDRHDSIMEVLSAPPRGDERIILAHQFIAAWLNRRNGAWACIDTDAKRAFWRARRLFESDLEADRAHWIYLSEILDDYNNGLMGPQHCD